MNVKITDKKNGTFLFEAEDGHTAMLKAKHLEQVIDFLNGYYGQTGWDHDPVCTCDLCLEAYPLRQILLEEEADPDQ